MGNAHRRPSIQENTAQSRQRLLRLGRPRDLWDLCLCEEAAVIGTIRDE